MENTTSTEYEIIEKEQPAPSRSREPSPRPQAIDRQVLLITAAAPPIEGKEIFFLLSFKQVEDILPIINVQPSPLAPHFADGVAEWRNLSVPVLSLERYLGIQADFQAMSWRYIVVRSPGFQDGDTGKQLGIIKVLPHIEQRKLPTKTQPIDVSDWCPDSGRLRGAYEWGKKILIVADLRRLLSAADIRDHDDRDSSSPAGNGHAPI